MGRIVHVHHVEDERARCGRSYKEKERGGRSGEGKKRKMHFEYHAYQSRQRRKIEDARKQRQKDFEEKWTKSWEVEAANKAREGKIFRERVLYEANLAREKEEEEEVTSKKKGKGPCSMQ